MAQARDARAEKRISRSNAGGSSSLRRVLAPFVTPLLIAAVLAALVALGAFRVTDGMLFDAVTTLEGPRESKVILVEQDEAFLSAPEGRSNALAEAARTLGARQVAFLQDPGDLSDPRVIRGRTASRVPGKSSWQIEGEGQPGAVAAMIAAPAYGIHRVQLGWLDGEAGRLPLVETAAAGLLPRQQQYYVRMSNRQPVARIDASQILGGQLGTGELDGLVVLVAPLPGSDVRRIVTPAAPDGPAISGAEFSARALQTLLDGSASYRMPPWQSALAILALCLSLAILFRRIDPKRLAIPLVLALTVVLLGLGWLMLEFGNLLLPLTALIAGLWIVTGLILVRSERTQDRKLDRIVGRAVNSSLRRMATRDQSNLPHFLLSSAKLIGVERMLLFSIDTEGRAEELAALYASLDDLPSSAGSLSRQLGKVRASHRPQPAGQLLASEEGASPAQLAWLGQARGTGSIYWLFAFGEERTAGKDDERERLAMALAHSYQLLHQWQADIASRMRQERGLEPIEGRLASALSLITDQASQVRAGLDALDTAVMVYHLIGFPLHANRQMEDFFELAGIPLAEASLAEALPQLTELGPRRVEAMLRDLLRNGGEMRVPARKVDTHKRILRVAAPEKLARGGERVIVLEAIDISELDRLAELRLAVSTFIDSQLRNDLEAIALGARLAHDRRMDGAASDRVIQRIADLAKRATGRLEEVAELTRESQVDILALSPSYPVEARKTVEKALADVSRFAADLDVQVEADLPGISGFSVAEPVALAAMIEAMLRVVIADTAQGGTVKLVQEEDLNRTVIRISGGVGIAFERLCATLDAPTEAIPEEFRDIVVGMRQAIGWNASVSYFSAVGGGYNFTIELKRIA